MVSDSSSDPVDEVFSDVPNAVWERGTVYRGLYERAYAAPLGLDWGWAPLPRTRFARRWATVWRRFATESSFPSLAWEREHETHNRWTNRQFPLPTPTKPLVPRVFEGGTLAVYFLAPKQRLGTRNSGILIPQEVNYV